MDFNYSIYSYQRFYPGLTESDIHAMWMDDLAGLMDTYDKLPNAAYYLPYFRTDNCSHCVTIPPIGNDPIEPLDEAKALNTPWAGSEIEALQLNVIDFARFLLDDSRPLQSYIEDANPTESFTPQISAQCMAGG